MFINGNNIPNVFYHSGGTGGEGGGDQVTASITDGVLYLKSSGNNIVANVKENTLYVEQRGTE